MKIITSLAICGLISLTSSINADDSPDVRVTNIRRAFHNGEHNAFTDLIHWRGKFWLAFRSCPDGHMVHPSSSIIILNSTDTKEWTPVHRFSVSKRDTRDPHFLVFKEKLFVYTGTWYSGDTSPPRSEYSLNRHLGYCAWSNDGVEWNSPVMLEGTFGHYIWRAASYDGKAYLCGRRNHDFDITAVGEGSRVESVMLESDDGLTWRKQALFQEERGDETAFLFETDGRVLAIGRSQPHAQLIQSRSPYTEWTRRPFDRHIGGPLVIKWGKRYIVGGRKSGEKFTDNGRPKTSLYWLHPDAETPQAMLTEFAELLSGGDNSYPGFVAISPQRAVVSWYSSHEKDTDGKSITAIYMAQLEVVNQNVP